MSSGSRWGRRRARRAEDEFREAAEAAEDEGVPERPGAGPTAAPGSRRPSPRRGGGESGLDGLFDTDQPDPEADALESELRSRDEPRRPADERSQELAALLAEAEAQAGPPPEQQEDETATRRLEIERDTRTPTALSREPVALPPPPQAPPPQAAAPAAPAEAPPGEPAGAGRDPGESWDAIESLFTRRVQEAERGESDAGLGLEWERPEMFTEPTQEEILRRISELAHGLEAVEQRVEELARPLAELTEPGTRLAAAFKRLELIERGFEEMRLSGERNTLKTQSGLSSLESGLGELRAAMEEPMWEMSERLTSAEIRLTELQASERLIEQVNTALAKDPFDLVSTRDIDEITDGITTKVKRLGARVERLDAALDRGLSGLEEARRAALSAARELNKAIERANREAAKKAPAPSKAAPKAAAKTAPAKKTAAKKTAARKPAAKKRTAR